MCVTAVEYITVHKRMARSQQAACLHGHDRLAHSPQQCLITTFSQHIMQHKKKASEDMHKSKEVYSCWSMLTYVQRFADEESADHRQLVSKIKKKKKPKWACVMFHSGVKISFT